MARGRCAGINVPVFSLRTKRSLGCGELLDLIPLIDWAKEAKLKIIQLLPVNDTSIIGAGYEGYPYCILSAFALHPIYLNLQALAPDLEEEIFRPFVKELSLPQFDYGRTYLAKCELLKMLYIMRGERDLESESFKAFYEANRNTLKSYAAFCALQSHYQTSDFSKWGRAKTYSELLVDEVCETYDVSFFYFVQYHLDRQMKQVVAHAKKHQILLKGDFPMGIHPHSVEAWRFSEYLRPDQVMGAPPDFYNDQGQNWGFPSYDWDEIKEENFFWLKARLKWMEQYFDIARLDHTLGYFRLWEIPKGEKSALMGTFYPALGYSRQELTRAGLRFATIEALFLYRHERYHPRVNLRQLKAYSDLDPDEQAEVFELFTSYFHGRQHLLWKAKGMEKLALMKKATVMELCVEDIGVIPACAAEVFADLKLLNLHVQRMPKSFEIDFEDPEDFPESCVCMPSNHDTATLREWWEEDSALTQKYYHTILKHTGEAPPQLSGSLAREIIAAHLGSKARYAIFLIQDLFAMREELRSPHPEKQRINDPASAERQWTWRMHLYVEELLLSGSFTREIRRLIEEAKR